MKGHEKLIEMRIYGSAPKIVFLNDYPCKTNWFETGDHVTICTHSDSIGSLDMRFLMGLAVSVSSSSENRAKALFNACKSYGAKTVAACHVQSGVHMLDQTGWAEVWRKDVANG
jgi:hypothetical protein